MIVLDDKKAMTAYIENQYVLSNNELGWDLLFCSYKNMLNPRYPIAFFGLNPGGSGWTQGAISCEGKCAYYDEEWYGAPAGEAPFQQQMRALFSLLGNMVGATYQELMDGCLMTNYIPPRSPNWHALNNKQMLIEKMRPIWADRINKVYNRLYISISQLVFDELHQLLLAQGYQQIGKEHRMHIGWGRVTYQMRWYEREGKKSLLIRLPHLSTYKIFSRKNCEEQIAYIMSEAESILSN
ncbi:hypothetical protein [Aeromonas hydrophila]|uniref:hypothetical protein n=1 Tax=Aeromonas hydrophila TaxID=644 RepID=UPI00398694A9